LKLGIGKFGSLHIHALPLNYLTYCYEMSTQMSDATRDYLSEIVNTFNEDSWNRQIIKHALEVKEPRISGEMTWRNIRHYVERAEGGNCIRVLLPLTDEVRADSGFKTLLERNDVNNIYKSREAVLDSDNIANKDTCNNIEEKPKMFEKAKLKLAKAKKLLAILAIVTTLFLLLENYQNIKEKVILAKNKFLASDAFLSLKSDIWEIFQPYYERVRKHFSWNSKVKSEALTS
jgi:hypothetical protein